jgi:hypothetical protein
MNALDIQIKLDQLRELLLGKGFYEASASFTIQDSESWSSMKLEFDYKATSSSGRRYETIRPRDLSSDGLGVTAEDIIVAAFKKVADVPTQREQLIKDFVNQLEALKTSAEDLEIDADFVNPLVGLMEKLASNALPAPKR